MESRKSGRYLAAFVAFMVVSGCVWAQTAAENSSADAKPESPAITVDKDAAVHFPALTVPFSIFASKEARKAYLDKLARRNPLGADGGADVGAVRENVITFFTPLLDRATALYPVNIETQVIAGVTTDIVTPKDGVSDKNRNRVLINLHGGGFFVGGRIFGKIEAAPIAGLGKYKVIAIDYRQGPEYKFPAASEDVTLVYKELLKHYKAVNIGIYGCSAGGVLTAEVAARLQKEKLPNPGGIGIFCASASGWAGGDSSYFTAPYGRALPPPETGHSSVTDALYFSDADMKDPMVSPVWAPHILAKFPPTLVVTGTRDFALSSAVFTHSQLVKEGVDAELHVWEGVDHGFFLDAALPESKEAYSVIVKFFDRHLGK